MKMRGKSILVQTIFVAIALTLILPCLSLAGSLEPSGPPGSTMYTLEEILTAATPLPTGFELWPNNPRFAVSNEGTPDEHSDDVVLDRATGLMWTRDVLVGTIHWQDAVDYCDSLEIGRLSTLATDWRLPSIEELTSLSEPFPSTVSPALPAGHPFINVQSSWYWSATTLANLPSFAWLVSMFNGNVSTFAKNNSRYVWCVRGGQSIDTDQTPPAWSERILSDRFVKALDNDGVVRDKETGLVWQKNLDTTTRDWYDAQIYCNGLDLGLRKGWRLPTLQELASLVDTSASGSPKLPIGHPFGNAEPLFYWAATSDAMDAAIAWGVRFDTGGAVRNAKNSPYSVWCVRGGQGVEAQ